MERNCKFVVESVAEDGRRFRPSDWIERISTMLATFGPDNRLQYANAVRPQIIDGQKCLVVDQKLKDQNPDVYEYILEFVRVNGLRIHEECE